MNANQVVIVMDRERLDDLIDDMGANCACLGPGHECHWCEHRAELSPALDRDPDELVEQGAASLHARHIPLEWGISFDDCSDEIQDEYRAMARSVLAVLGEEGGPE